ncbi:MAG: DUF1016 family protein [Bacilli bacterium]|nr:DUF1016 family protein [Bacilli bacterium]
MNYYNEIKNKLLNNEIYERVKNYSKESNRVITYFEVGRLLYDAGSKYGENIIGKYAEKLVNEVGKKYNIKTLYKFRLFYLKFRKFSTMSRKLNWSHYSELLSIKDTDKINYYINLINNQTLSVRELRERIKNKEYERLDNDTKSKLINKKDTDITDFIKNPIVIKNTLNKDIISERVLKELILDNISVFLKELGSGYSYIDNEYKIKIGERYNYIDLLLFNIKYDCYVVVELKVTELKKEYVGQILTYKNYIDNNIMEYHNETIGIIISKKDNKYIMSYCTDERILSREYKLI